MAALFGHHSSVAETTKNSKETRVAPKTNTNTHTHNKTKHGRVSETFSYLLVGVLCGHIENQDRL